jgi:hypothetical protein
VLTLAGFSYGPLLGLYGFGLFSKNFLNDWHASLISILSPLICIVLYFNSHHFGFQLGFEILLINGGITYIGLLAMSKSIKSN